MSKEFRFSLSPPATAAMKQRFINFFFLCRRRRRRPIRLRRRRDPGALSPGAVRRPRARAPGTKHARTTRRVLEIVTPSPLFGACAPGVFEKRVVLRFRVNHTYT